MGLRRTVCESAAESLAEPQPVPWASAEDLVQTAMLQSWLHWDAIRTDAPELHVRRVLTNTFLSRQRRRPGQRAQLTLRVGTATRTRRQVAEAFPPVEVYPPDQTAPLRIPFTTGSCDLSVRSVAVGP